MQFGTTFDACVTHDIKAGLIPFLMGEPGIGKSAAVQGVANEMNAQFFTVACNQLSEKADLTGVRTVPVEDKNGNVTTYEQVFFPMADITRAVRAANANPHGLVIVFLDEINRTTPDVTSALLSLQTMRRLGNLDMPSNLAFVCAGNDHGNVTSLDTASLSRFSIYHMTPDAQTWLKVNPNANAWVTDTLAKHPEMIFCKESVGASSNDDEDDENYDIDDILLEGQETRQFTCPRTITYLSNWLNTFEGADGADTLRAMMCEHSTFEGQEVSSLEEAIFSKVGNTAFGAQMVLTITDALAKSQTSQSGGFKMPRPVAADELSRLSTMKDIDAFVQTLSVADRSALLAWALTGSAARELHNPATLTAAINACLASMTPDTADMAAVTNIITANSQGVLDDDATTVVKQSATPLAALIGKFL